MHVINTYLMTFIINNNNDQISFGRDEPFGNSFAKKTVQIFFTTNEIFPNEHNETILCIIYSVNIQWLFL